MSIMNAIGERVFLAPEPRSARPVRSAAIRRRNRRWLARQRRDDLTTRELARLLGKPAATVAAGLLWAVEDEEAREERLVASLQSTEICPITGLTVDDVLYLLDQYPPGTEVGDNPWYQEFLGPLRDRVAAMYGPWVIDPEEATVPGAEAA